MKVLNNYLAVEPVEEESTSPIINPDEMKSQNKGRVVHVGDKCEIVAVGDLVYYNAASPIGIDNLFILKEEQIVAIA